MTLAVVAAAAIIVVTVRLGQDLSDPTGLTGRVLFLWRMQQQLDLNGATHPSSSWGRVDQFQPKLAAHVSNGRAWIPKCVSGYGKPGRPLGSAVCAFFCDPEGLYSNIHSKGIT